MALRFSGQKAELAALCDLELDPEHPDDRLAAYIRQTAERNGIDYDRARDIIRDLNDPLRGYMTGAGEDMARHFRSFVWALA